MGSPFAFRPYPPSGVEELPGSRDPGAHFAVAFGADCVLLCDYGHAARWRGAVLFTADEARRLGMRLMVMADRAEGDVT